MAGVTNGALARLATTTETALQLNETTTREEWEQIGDTLRAIKAGVDWWLADWWRFGERKYGQAAAQAAPLGFAAKTLQNAAWTASKIEPSRRREDLDMGHHHAVAGMEPDDQDLWLDRAAGSDWSVGELRGRIKAETRPVDQPSEVTRLLRRAVAVWTEDPESGGMDDFLAECEEAWHHAHRLRAVS